MTFGYDASTAFGNSTADIVDHAKALLSSLVDKREEENVSIHLHADRRMEIGVATSTNLPNVGSSETTGFHRSFAWRHNREAG